MQTRTLLCDRLEHQRLVSYHTSINLHDWSPSRQGVTAKPGDPCHPGVEEQIDAQYYGYCPDKGKHPALERVRLKSPPRQRIESSLIRDLIYMMKFHRQISIKSFYFMLKQSAHTTNFRVELNLTFCSACYVPNNLRPFQLIKPQPQLCENCSNGDYSSSWFTCK